MKRICFFSVAMIFACSFVSGQRYEAALDSFRARNNTEKIYLHCDKDFYVAGETIWFKSYLLNKGKPGGLSSNLFVQLVDEKGKIVVAGRYPVMGAVAKGSIQLSDSLPQGNYYIRALTAGMLNRREQFIYKKNIPVLRPGGGLSFLSQKSNLIVNFIPEGGNMIDGILTVVAFKITDQAGRPLDINGSIKTEDGIAIAGFKTYHDGIGRMQFKPQAGKKYFAEIITDAGPVSYPLPAVQNAGVSLKLSDEKGGKKFQLSRGENDKQLFDVVTIIAEINNQLVYENEIAFENYPSVIGHILTDSLPSGILHFTVFGKDGKVLADRLSFINNGEYRSPASINAVKKGTGKREENEIEFTFNNAAQRSLSVSVTSYPATQLPDQDNSFSHLLLASELEDNVFNPGWYLINQTDSAKLAIDNLMIMQRKKGFSWNNLLKNQDIAHNFSDPDFLAISGMVTDEKTKAPLVGGRLNFSVEAEDSANYPYEVLVNAKGRFALDSLFFNGRSKVFYAYTDAKDKVRNVQVMADEDTIASAAVIIPAGFSNGIAKREFQTGQNNAEVANRFSYSQKELEAIKELEQVTVQATRKKSPFEVVNEKYTTGVFRSDGKENIDLINNPPNDKGMSAVDFIKNRIQQLELQAGGFVNRKNMSLMSGQKWAVGIFIDEEPSNIGFLRLLRANDLALVKFYEAGFVGVGSSFPGGAVAVYTKNKNKEETKPGMLEFFPRTGYALTKEFYSPDYSKPESGKTALDNRSTLYWYPDMITDAEIKSVKLKFFNNDFSKKYKVVIEGFDADGKLIHEEVIIGD